MKKIIEEGGMLPRGYATAYDQWQYSPVRHVTYPVGVHFLVRWARELYWWVVRFDLQEARIRALRHRELAAFDRGYAQGWNENEMLRRGRNR